VSATCRSCGAAIIWAETVNGKKMPLDADPAERPNGLFRLEGDKAISVSGEPVYISHFVTCPNAAQHRRAS
jgi:hypothetical protein